VRLTRGDRATAHAWADDPVDQARSFVDQGAAALHVVDLDAAFGGARQLPLIERIVKAAGRVPVQVGGGLRDLDAAAQTLGAGATRVILGTAAVEDPNLAGAAVAKFGADHVACGIDVKEGRAATRGWTEARGPAAGDLAGTLAAQGVSWFVVTAIARDGTLEGFDIPLLREVEKAAPLGRLIASGGAGDLSHLRVLVNAGLDTLAGAIAGTALYEGKFTLHEARAVMGEE
jgi:phosphoribosylformimino-5-aminoimidazole carboxamide ribotide isomerase